MKLYTELEVRKAIELARLIQEKGSVEDSFDVESISGLSEICTYGWRERYSTDEISEQLTPIELPSDEEIEEKLNVAYGNGYEQGEMDFYKKMKGQGNEYADGYAEGYQRALELVKFQIVERLEKGGNNEQQ
jgi:hypothetical protein